MATKTDLKRLKKLLKVDLAKLCDELEADINLSLASVSEIKRKLEKLYDLHVTVQSYISQLREVYEFHSEIDKIAQLSAESRACEDVYNECVHKVKVWIHDQETQFNVDTSATLKKLAAFDSSGSDQDARHGNTAKASKRYSYDPLYKKLSESKEKLRSDIHDMCDKAGLSYDIKKTSTPYGKYVDFRDPGISDFQDGGGSDPSSSDSSDTSSSSSSSDDGPLLSASDVMHGLGGLAGAREVGKRRKKKKKSKKHSVDSMEPYIQRLQLPVFDGSDDFLDWWYMFEAIVDKGKQPVSIKFLRLKQCLKGEPLKIVRHFSHDKKSYRRAKSLLYDAYGGLRRQNRRMYDEIDMFPEITEFDFISMKNLLGLVDRTIRLLEQTNQKGEIGPSRLHSDVIAKLHPNSIYKYHDWCSTNECDDDLYSVSKFLEEHSSKGIVALESSNRSKNKVKYKKLSKVSITESMSNLDVKPKETISETGSVSKNQPTTGDTKNKSRCRLCKVYGHPVWKCEKFLSMSVSERWDAVRSTHICYKCLSPAHQARNCERARTCGIQGCTYKHNRLLHDKSVVPSKTKDAHLAESKHTDISENNNNDSSCGPDSNTSGDQTSPLTVDKNSMITFEQYKGRTVSLGITPVLLINGDRTMTATAMIDSGSNVTFITREAAEYLSLEGVEDDSYIVGFGGHVTKDKNLVCELTIADVDKTVFQTDIVEVVTQVTGKMNIVDWKFYKHSWEHLRSLNIRSVGNKKNIDVLIGLNYLKLVAPKSSVIGVDGAPIAVHYPLGWVCQGCPYKSQALTNDKFTFTVMSQTKLDSAIAKFWSWEEPAVVDSDKSIIDKKVEEMTRKSLKYLNPGYQVGIPWINGRPTNYKSNKKGAIQRLIQTERKLRPDPLVARDYHNMFVSYCKKGYFRKCIIDCSDNSCYLPHFPIVKKDRQTTKVRPVFDASALFDGVCINDFEFCGPKLQQDLVKVLLRFRRFAIVLGCDIGEMYLKIRIDPLDIPFQKVLWRGMDTSAEIDTYEATRVMFGRKSSPFLALFVSLANAEKWKVEYPRVYDVIKNSTYMDDSLDSVPDISEALVLYKDLNFVWGDADMIPQKWVSNSHEVLSAIPEDMRAVKLDLTKLESPVGKMLGISWNPKTDTLTFVFSSTSYKVSTKRGLLKIMAGIFDPLGMILPYTVRAKVFFQNLWTGGYDWDQPLSEAILVSIQKWVDEAQVLQQIAMERVFFSRGRDITYITLHIFSDACTRAYGCVAFIVDHIAGYSRFVMAKNKIAPIKIVSIPRLELQGAVVGAQLAQLLKEVLEIPQENVWHWVDNHDVLYWIKSLARTYKPFIANRISLIQELSNPHQWLYVPTKQNPADVVTRGCSAQDLVDHELWWSGPEFIKKGRDDWPEQPNIQVQTGQEKRKVNDWTNCFHMSSYKRMSSIIDIERYSSLRKLLRVTCHIFRFIKRSDKCGEFDVDEMDDALKYHIAMVQNEVWFEDMLRMMNNKALKDKKLEEMNPWLDEQNIVRSSTRLVNDPELGWDETNPIILPSRHRLTMLILRHIHQTNNHAGVSYCLSEFRKEYISWGIRERIRNLKYNCVFCKIQSARPMSQRMGRLPLLRTQKTGQVFQNSCVDFAGPFFTKQGRGRSQLKRWVCIFSCLSVRAVHIELVPSLATDDFLAALERFTRRRGKPINLYCDNGTNFHGADSELALLVKDFDNTKIKKFCTFKKINWIFMPSGAPHMGGAHEIMVKAMKRSMGPILHKADITDFEMQTALAITEGILNNRPLTYVSADHDSIRPLTPNHFLIGHTNVEIGPPLEKQSTNSLLRKRWSRVHELIQHLWSRWVDEWLKSISNVKKWHKVYQNVKENDIVLVLEQQTYKGTWRLGKIVKTYPGKDGLVRTVDVLTNGKVFKKPIVKLVHLTN